MRTKLTSLFSITLLLVFLVACNKKPAPQEQGSNQKPVVKEHVSLQRTSWQELGINGRVQEFTKHTHPAEKKDGKWVSTWSPSNYITTFTKEGMLASESILDQEMNLMDHFVYGSKEKSLLDITYNFGKPNSYYGKFFGYGKVIYSGDTTMTCLIYADSTMQGDPTFSIKRTFNKEGLLVSHSWTDIKFNIVHSNSNRIYNEKHDLISSTGDDIYLGEGTFSYVYEYLDFDSNNNWTERHVIRTGVDKKIKHFLETRAYVYYPNK